MRPPRPTPPAALKPRSPDATRAAAARRPAFTLIELLVVVSIIALLIGIIIPTLQIARDKAKDTACQANQRSLVQAWHSFIAEKRRFPNDDDARSPTDLPPIGGRWGGATTKLKDAYGRVVTMQDRPLNEYVGLDSATRTRLNAFRCPRDNGAIYAGYNFDLRQADGLATEYVDDDGSDNSLFFIEGNSYYANDWVWANVGAFSGAGTMHWNHFNVPDQVLVYPSDTMCIADGGAAYSLSMTPEQRANYGVKLAWWHGDDAAFMGMWDGSVRFVRSHIGGAGPEFNRWLIPERHNPEGTPVARFSGLRNPGASTNGNGAD